MSFCWKRAISSWSAGVLPWVASTTSTAQSARLRACFVFFTRSSPRAPSSSKPGVSMMTTGPMGSSSMDFITGSVVVPFTSETTESSWLVKALTTLDLPAFLRPKKPMCTLSAEGVLFRLMCIPPCPVPGLSIRGPWPDRTSRLLAFHLFKGGRVWDSVPRP